MASVRTRCYIVHQQCDSHLLFVAGGHSSYSERILGNWCRVVRNLATALVHCEAAVAILRHVVSLRLDCLAHCHATLRNRLCLASELQRLGHFAEALPISSEVTSIFAAQLGGDHGHTLVVRKSLAWVLATSGELDVA